MTKRNPMIEAQTAQAIRTAHHFTTTIYSNHSYVTWRFVDLAAARAAAPRLERLVANHRKAMIYAVTPDGLTHFVPN